MHTSSYTVFTEYLVLPVNLHISVTFSFLLLSFFFFFFNDTATTEIYTLSLHDALPIYLRAPPRAQRPGAGGAGSRARPRGERSEEHTSELQSRFDLVCRLLLEKKKKKKST